MSKPKAFMDLALAGMIVDPEREIDRHIAEWHETRTKLSLHDWLGMTAEEYAMFVENPTFLRVLLDRASPKIRRASGV